jgi:hypothetical protein
MSAEADVRQIAAENEEIFPRKMTLYLEGYTSLVWGEPPEALVRNVETAVGQQMAGPEYYVRGLPESPLSKALNEYMDYSRFMNDKARVRPLVLSFCQFTY